MRADNFFVRAAKKNVFTPLCRQVLELSKLVKKNPGKSRNQKLEVPKHWSKIGQNFVATVKPDAKVVAKVKLLLRTIHFHFNFHCFNFLCPFLQGNLCPIFPLIRGFTSKIQKFSFFIFIIYFAPFYRGTSAHFFF